jgi:hypothetical protein
LTRQSASGARLRNHSFAQTSLAVRFANEQVRGLYREKAALT